MWPPKSFSLFEKLINPSREPLPFFRFYLVSHLLDIARASHLGSLPLNLPHLAHPPHSQTANTGLIMTFCCLEPTKDPHRLWNKIQLFQQTHGFLDLASTHFSTVISQQFTVLSSRYTRSTQTFVPSV